MTRDSEAIEGVEQEQTRSVGTASCNSRQGLDTDRGIGVYEAVVRFGGGGGHGWRKGGFERPEMESVCCGTRACCVFVSKDVCPRVPVCPSQAASLYNRMKSDKLTPNSNTAQ